MIDCALVDAVLAEAWRRGSHVHGEEHWRCVTATGLELAGDLPGSDPELVFLFGLLHDTRRENDRVDPDHGPRAAAFARRLHERDRLQLGEARLGVLCHAIELHADGHVSNDPTVGACWDADRLHLPRVRIDPDPERFSTSLARGRGRLAAAASLRAAPPTWAELVDELGRKAGPGSSPAV